MVLESVDKTPNIQTFLVGTHYKVEKESLVSRVNQDGEGINWLQFRFSKMA